MKQSRHGSDIICHGLGLPTRSGGPCGASPLRPAFSRRDNILVSPCHGLFRRTAPVLDQENGSSSRPGLCRVGQVPSSPSIPRTATRSPHLIGSACLDLEGDADVPTPQPL
ncbi:hypothetical protein HAX54_000892 [Datura stramonium]|uniref:Uncharacterized protein n=1 Tax=Datura stramonium TaxID=4076 RepID=A0ABS8T3L0_DATST|nr:hypothetical protein [Datura stramonium]